MMNLYASTSPRRFFTQKVFCTKMLLNSSSDSSSCSSTVEDESGRVEAWRDGRVAGRLTLQGRKVKRVIGEKTEVLGVFESEEERVNALREWFGIELTASEIGGIAGTVTELVSK